MLQDECDMEEIGNEDADTMDMNIVKQMIGLKINDGDNEQDRNSSSDSDAPARVNILSTSNKIYDFKNPSSKVINIPFNLNFQYHKATYHFILEFVFLISVQACYRDC